MSEMEIVLQSALFKFVLSGCVVLAQLYLLALIKPIKKSIERIQTEDSKQWDAIGSLEERLCTLQGEHNERKGRHK